MRKNNTRALFLGALAPWVFANRVALIVAGSFLIAAIAADSARAQDAVAYQLDPAHDGAATFPAFSQPAELWSVNLGGGVSDALIKNGEIFVTVAELHETELVALNARSGHIDWTTPIPGGSFDTAAYDNGSVYVVDTTPFASAIYAYNATSGSLLWSQSPGGELTSFDSPPTATTGQVYISGTGIGGALYAFQESNGAKVFTPAVSSGAESDPAIAGNSVYVSYGAQQTYSFNATTGALNWQYQGQTGGGAGSTPVYYNGNVYAVWLGQLISLNATTGSLNQNFNLSVTENSTYLPAFDNGIGYIISQGTLKAFNPSTGASFWSDTLPGLADFIGPPIVVNGNVFAEIAGSGIVDEFNGQNGTLIDSLNTGASLNTPIGSPLIGLSAGDELLAIPVGTTLTVYAVPEPNTFVLVVLGLLMLVFCATISRVLRCGLS